MMKDLILNFFRNKNVKQYASNTGWMLGERIIAFPVLFFINIVMVPRALGPENFGLLSYAQSVVTLFSILTSLGLDGISVRELVRSKTDDERNEIMGTLWGLKISGTAIFVILLFFWAFFNETEHETRLIIWIIASGFLFFSLNVIDFFYQSMVKAKYAVWARLMMLFFVAGWRLLLIYSNADLVWYAVVLFSEQFLFGILLLVFYQKHGYSVLKWNFSSQRAKTIMKDAWPMIMSGIFVSLYMRIDQVMIKNTLDDKQLGIYAVAVKISELWYFVPTVFTASVFPAVLKAREISEHKFNKQVQTMFDAMYWFALIVVVFFFFFADFILKLLYGEMFLDAAPILKIHAWSGLFVAVGVARSKWVLTENLQRYTMMYLAVGAVTNIVFNFILIPKYGLLGAAWATLFSYFIFSFITPALFKPTRITFYMFLKSIVFYQVFEFLFSRKRKEL